MKTMISILHGDIVEKRGLTVRETADYLETDKRNIYNALKNPTWLCKGYSLEDESQTLKLLLEDVTPQNINLVTEAVRNAVS